MDVSEVTLEETNKRQTKILNARVDTVLRMSVDGYANEHEMNVSSVVELALEQLLNNAVDH
jgi:predicted solute-binding protein